MKRKIKILKKKKGKKERKEVEEEKKMRHVYDIRVRVVRQHTSGLYTQLLWTMSSVRRTRAIPLTGLLTRALNFASGFVLI